MLKEVLQEEGNTDLHKGTKSAENCIYMNKYIRLSYLTLF